MTMRTHSESMEVNEAAEGSFGKKWWAWRDLNSRPFGYQPNAPTKLSYKPINKP
jgi:hypothetical protein